MPLIALRKVSRRYDAGGLPVGALNEVTLDIHAGEFIAVMGPSGSGKTTLMNIIGCLDRPSGGEYWFAGQPTHTANADERARLRREVFGFVFQNYNLLRMATAKENVEMPAIYAGARKRARMARALELLKGLGLSHRVGHHPSELSGGEQQRVAIARALMNGGQVVLADEPTGSLDSRTGEEIMAHLKSLSDRGHTVILVTHDPGVARHAQRRVELLDGRVVADTGAPPEPRRRGPAMANGVAGASKAGLRARALSLQESARTALRALRSNKFRTSLTLLGIIIGVLSVTAMLGVAEGVRREILDNLSQLGGASVVVMPLRGPEGQNGSLTLEDAKAIREQVPNVVTVAPEMNGYATLTAGSEQQGAPILATTGASMQESSRKLAQGVFFTDSHSDNYTPVVVLGGHLAGALFGQDANPVGEYLLIDNIPFQVIGALKRREGWRYAYSGGGRSAIVPLETGAVRLFNRDGLDALRIMVSAPSQAEAAQTAIESLLRLRHGATDFRIENRAELVEAQNSVANFLRLLLGAIGGISLVVAGIGVMNIMLAAVAERTREIGLRMATGARPRDILLQFVCEAVVVSGLGGVAGLLLAFAVGRVLNAFGAAVAFTPSILLIGLSCATVTGLVFGFAPARRASRLDPVAALAAQ